MRSAWLSSLAKMRVLGTQVRRGPWLWHGRGGREDLGEEFFAEVADDGADLIGDDDGAVELGLLPGLLGFLDFPALGAGEAVAFLIVCPA